MASDNDILWNIFWLLVAIGLAFLGLYLIYDGTLEGNIMESLGGAAIIIGEGLFFRWKRS